MNAPDKAISLTLPVTGMHCASCVGRVEKILLEHTGVLGASVNLATGDATVQLTEDAPAPQSLADALTNAGYKTELATPADQPGAKDTRAAREKENRNAERRNLILAIAFTLPVFVSEMGGHLFPSFANWLNLNIGVSTLHWMQLVFSAVVLFIAGREFFRIGVPALRRLAPEMNSLVAIGATTAWTYSALITIAPSLLPASGGQVYFEAAAVVVTLVLLGRYLEARARGQTSRAIDALTELQPDTAMVLRGDTPVPTPLADIRSGDRLQIKPGERIAVDGVIRQGTGRIDESMLTGEAIAVSHEPGENVFAGTINTSGSLIIEATAVGQHTALSGIIKQVTQAQTSKLPIQALVDKIAMWFVPAVIAIAVVTFITWLLIGEQATALQSAIIYAVSVLIVACPCAMGLATPLSIMVGTGQAARNGILFRHGEALQRLGQVRTIAFDKTGTLTLGEPVVTEIITTGGFDGNDVLRWCGAAQRHSEHPISRAVVAACAERGLDLSEATNFEAVAGRGIQATVDRHRVIAGAAALLESQNIPTDSLSEQGNRLAGLGHTTFLVAVDGKLAALISVADTVRPEAAAVIEKLTHRGLNIVMISGDRIETAQAIAAQLGISQVLGGVMPGEKQHEIKQLQLSKGPVAFVGDGINDAPALAAADVGVAIGGGTDVAIEAADLVLAGDNLHSIDRAIDASRATMRNIWQNLFWAFLYNVLLIPVAAGAFVFAGIYMSPMLAAAAMSLSSLFVVFNALRLNRSRTSNGLAQ